MNTPQHDADRELIRKLRAARRRENRYLGKRYYKMPEDEVKALVATGYRIRSRDIHVLPS